MTAAVYTLNVMSVYKGESEAFARCSSYYACINIVTPVIDSPSRIFDSEAILFTG